MKLFSVPFLPVNVGVDSQHGINASENVLVMVKIQEFRRFPFVIGLENIMIQVSLMMKVL